MTIYMTHIDGSLVGGYREIRPTSTELSTKV